MTTTALSFENTTKVYGKYTALKDVVLNIPQGEIMALVGHNGAGKTTMMKLLLGLIRPTSGSVRVMDVDPASSASSTVKRSLGFLPETVAFQHAMTGIEVMNFYGRLKRTDLSRNADLLDRVGLADAARNRVKTYSKGMRQRLGLAQALLGDPKVMLLDEPTSGLDPALRRSFYDTISALKAEGVTVLLSSHALTELEIHVDKVAIMNKGQLMATGNLDELRANAHMPVRIRVRSSDVSASDIASQLGGAEVSQINGHMVEFACSAQDKMILIRRIAELGVAVTDMEIELPSLDQLYSHYRHEETPS
ncbi:MAG: ABC transporter ATP-binding protein [Rhodospirillales bacterium]|jgi:Cu-processing system ATP-binding protein|nr:ABC transporter ATP-binding protein [Rhodospirillales bacterium]